MKYVYLRRPGAVKDPNGQPVSTGECDQLRFETADVDDKGLAELNRDPTVGLPSLEMPIEAIEPLAPSDGVLTLDKPPSISWGISAVKADQTQLDGTGIKIAVLDTGINRHHPAFTGFEDDDIVCENFTDGKDEDVVGHGTHCAATIFGRDVDNCRIGVARGVTQVLIGKVLGPGATTSSLNKAVLWAIQNGAHIISMSLGLNFLGHRQALEKDGYKDPVLTDMALAHYRDSMRTFDFLGELSTGNSVATGAVILAATGNGSKRPDFQLDAVPPAAARGFVSVGAVDQSQGITSFSNRGAHFVGPGEDIWSADFKGGLKAMSGTSMATPHAAGVAALCAQRVIAKHGRFSAQAVIDLMGRYALDLSETIDPGIVRSGYVQAPPN